LLRTLSAKEIIIILFARDWLKYPTARPDWDTRNRSFVRMAALLDSMGVKNCAFFLALLNPALKGVDPRDPNLTLEQMTAIGVECKLNPWYFFREVALAPGNGSVDGVMVEANRGNICLWWLFFNHITVFLIQIRQTGKSFSTDVLMVLLMEFICEKTVINLLTKDDTLRRANIERMKSIIADLPKYLQLKHPDDANNTEEITVMANGNRYKTHVPQMSEKRAINMGRGLTSPIFQIDEGPFQPNIKIALPAALAATGAAVDRAKEQGSPYGTIFTTTAGKKDDKDGAYMYKLISNACIWSEALYDCEDQEDLERTVLAGCRVEGKIKKAAVNATFNHRQLGKSDAWLAGKLADSFAEGDDANRDYFNMWTSGSQTSPLPLDVLEMMVRSVKDVAYTEITKPFNYITRWYIPKSQIAARMASGKFVFGMDTSEAIGRDEISFVLMDVESLEVVAAGSYNEINLIMFSKWLCLFMIQYPNVTGIIERKSTGGMILDYLIVNLAAAGIDPFKRLFNWVVNDHGLHRERYKEVCGVPMNRRPSDWMDRFKRFFGFATTGAGAQSRNELYTTTLQAAASLCMDRMSDKALVDQTVGLITKNGRVDHPPGEHDDMTIGWLLVNWMLAQGTNLVHYGIDPTKIMSKIAKRGKEVTLEDKWLAEEQAEYRQQMDMLMEQLKNEPDEFVSHRLEQELRRLDSRIMWDRGETHSLDQLLQNVKDDKWKKRARFTGNQKAPKWATNPGALAHRENHGFFSNSPFEGYRR